jgi:hypothetical protein
VHSTELDSAVEAFVDEAARRLQRDVARGVAIPFEVERRGSSTARTPLYCYRPLTAEFVVQRWRDLCGLESYAGAARALERFPGLDRYVSSCDGDAHPAAAGGTPARNAQLALWRLLMELFDGQTDFELRPERLREALEALHRSGVPGLAGSTVLATLHGVVICCAELALTETMRIVRPASAHLDAAASLPPEVVPLGPTDPVDHLLVLVTGEHDRIGPAVEAAREDLHDMLTALRLFGDGRVRVGELAWARIADGRWQVFAAGTSGGVARAGTRSGAAPEAAARARRKVARALVVTEAQEDELRAFWELFSRRAPEGNELGWALRRFELGCARADEQEALSDHLMALRALLEPEGSPRGALAARLATLCATPEDRPALARAIAQAIELERAVIRGAASRNAGTRALADLVAGHLRALLRDVICGHLQPDLAALADELMAAGGEAAAVAPPEPPLWELSTARAPAPDDRWLGLAGMPR